MEIKNETLKLIKSKVEFFNNKKYFKIFKDILLNLSMKCMKNENIILEYKLKSSNINMINNNKYKVGLAKKYSNKYLWLKIVQNIYSKREIKDYDYKNNFVQEKEYNSNTNDEDNCHVSFKDNKVKYEINNLVYSYLYHLCQLKLQKLLTISKKEKISLIHSVSIYLGLCSQNLGFIKMDLDDEEKNDSSSHRKNFFKMLSIKSDYNKKLNRNKIREKSLIINNKIYESKATNFGTNKSIYRVKNLSFTKKNLIRRYKSSKFQKTKDNVINNSQRNKRNDSNKNIYKEEEDEKNMNNFNTERMNEEFIKSINDLNQKNKNNSSKILYSSSFTRLFIGETDVKSIKERYNSNMNVKKEQKIEKKKKNINSNLSRTYLKMFLNKVSQIKKSKLPLIENNIEGVLKKYKKNQEIIDKFKRVSIKEEDLLNDDEKIYNENKRINNTLSKFDTSENIIKIDNRVDANNKCLTLSNKKIYNRLKKTPLKNKIMDGNNRKKVKDIFRSDNRGKILSSYKYKNNVRINRNDNHFFKFKINNKLIQKEKSKTILTERNNLHRGQYKLISAKNLNNNNKDSDGKEANTLYSGTKLNLLRKERNSHENLGYSQNSGKVKYFLTRKDFYFDNI